eukprot:13956608-Alexandrium_andersonii.AAC.1
MKELKKRAEAHLLERDRSAAAVMMRTARRWVITERELGRAEQEWKKLQDRMRAHYTRVSGKQESAEKILQLM